MTAGRTMESQLSQWNSSRAVTRRGCGTRPFFAARFALYEKSSLRAYYIVRIQYFKMAKGRHAYQDYCIFSGIREVILFPQVDVHPVNKLLAFLITVLPIQGLHIIREVRFQEIVLSFCEGEFITALGGLGSHGRNQVSLQSKGSIYPPLMVCARGLTS